MTDAGRRKPPPRTGGATPKRRPTSDTGRTSEPRSAARTPGGRRPADPTGKPTPKPAPKPTSKRVGNRSTGAKPAPKRSATARPAADRSTATKPAPKRSATARPAGNRSTAARPARPAPRRSTAKAAADAPVTPRSPRRTSATPRVGAGGSGAGRSTGRAAAARPGPARGRAAARSTAPKVKRPRRAPRRVRLADPRRRLHVSLVGVAVLLSLIGGRLIQLQGLDAGTYAAAAEGTRVRSVDIPADRGEILDRNGAPLAATLESYDVTVDQTLVENPAAYALQLEPLLDVPAATLQERLTGDKRFGYVSKAVPAATWRQVQELRLVGVYGEANPQRDYPSGSVGGAVLGFTGAEGVGLAGLELAFEDQLAGTDGSFSYQMGFGGRRIPLGSSSGTESTPGSSLRLTLDRDLQWTAEDAVARQVETAGADAGVATVLDVRTGEVLALVSVPSVDPNDPGSTDAEDRRNRAVEDSYEPGSVFKPLTAAAVIEEGEADASTVYSVPGRIRREGATIGDYYSHGEDRMTLAGIIAKSSNVGTILAAETIDKEVYRQYLADFGIGSTTGLGLPGETAGQLGTDMTNLTRDNVAFGQGVGVNVVQMAAAYATIANDGVRVHPRIVDSVIRPDGTEEPVADAEMERVISEETAAEVTAMMEAVMGPDGTGKPALVDGYRVAGKTGTAQRVDPACGCYADYNASFMGFAPAEDPRYVVAVSLFNTRNGNSGGALAGPAFADIMRFALQSTGVPPSTEPAPELPLFAEQSPDR